RNQRDTSNFMILVPLLNPKFANGLVAWLCELRVRGTSVRYQFTFRSQHLPRVLLLAGAVATVMRLSRGGGAQKKNGPHTQPLSEHMLAEVKAKNMEKDSPILMRIFKEEAELEVWKQDDSGRFALLRTYPICRWSGELGPKIKQGDRQAPEGFYPITPGLMN